MHGARILEHGTADYAARMVREEATAGVMVLKLIEWLKFEML